MPLLANLYLNPLDHGVNQDTGGQAQMIRYADDFVIACRVGSGKPVKQRLRRWLAAKGLELNEAKEVLRGWAGYFHFRISTRVFALMRRHSQNRLRRWLWRKQGCKHGRWQHYPDERLRDHYGLYELPVTAAWKANR